MDPNPRKTLRKHINHLENEMRFIKNKMERFAKEKERLKNIEANGSLGDAQSAAKHWSYLDWLAEPLL